MDWIQFFNQACVYLFTYLITWAAINDMRDYKIPNWINLALLILYVPFVLTVPAAIDWWSAIGIAGGILVVGFCMFAFNIMGAGDIKLFTVVALWAGPLLVYPVFTTMAIAGGALALAIAVYFYLSKYIGLRKHNPTKVVMPYGVAIAIGGYVVTLQSLQPLGIL